ncbi:Calcium-binding EF-hand family protein [Rhynchospora pubera]|uniref:Calcium-binding EF-hand family protein n=1 Tax=Rhynchospora pubera TaxID=906938 RepID=A0AAV8F1M7_9POAL|nr:Calcium-binding EF-hand family protein [Rhynchospora pubera]
MHCYTFKFLQFIFSSFKYIVQNDSIFLKNEREEEEAVLQDPCTFKEDVEVSYDDVNVVMNRLGIMRSNKYQNHNLIEEANMILEEKLATVMELKEAFQVIDTDMDGFITPSELWDLMDKLGLSEGMRYEDCERMIRVHDMDGDGKISLDEFQCMMEKAY